MRDNAKSGALTEVSFYILLALFKPMHGYAIMNYVSEKTHGRLILGAGSLYGALETMFAREWIKVFSIDSITKKKEYIITDKGKEIAIKELNRLKELVQVASIRIEGENYGEEA